MKQDLVDYERELYRLRRAFDSSADALYLIDLEDERHTFLDVNETACRELGYSRNELIGMGPLDIDPDITHEMLKQFTKTLTPGQVDCFETRHRTRDGHIFPVEISSNIFQEDGHRYTVAVVRNISERKKTEQELAQREQEFRSLAENLPDNVARYDLQCRIIYINPQMEKTLAFIPTELIGKTPVECFPNDKEVVDFQDTLRKVIDSGQPAEFLAHLPAPDGGVLYHNIRLVAERDEQDRVIAVLAIGRDITKLKQMELELVKREQDFRSLAESSPENVIRYDLEGRILYINNNLIKDMGLNNAEEVLGRKYYEVWPGKLFSELKQAIAKVTKKPETRRVELNYSIDGEKLSSHEIFVVPERDVSGKLIGILAFGRDISKIRESELLLQQILDNLPGLAFTFHLDTNGKMSFPYISANVKEFYHITPEQVQADYMALYGLAHADDQPRIEAAIARSARHMSPFYVNFRVCVPGQPQRWFESRSVSITRNDTGILWYGIMLDITERKSAEAQREISERRFRTLAENLPDNLVRYDRKCRIVYANPKFKNMMSAVTSSLIGKTAMEIAPDKKKEKKQALHIQNLVKKVIITGIPESMEIVIDLPGYDSQVHHIIVVAERNKQGEIQGALAIGRDITEQKEAQEQLRMLSRHLETVREEERKHIARELHDELGQLLTAIRMGVSMLKLDYLPADIKFQEKTGNLVGIVDKTIHQVRSVVNLLRPAVLERGVVASLEWLAEDFQAKSGIICELEVCMQQVQVSEEYAIAIFRIVQESLTNTFRHAAALRVYIELKCNHDQCLLRITDNGKGFKKNQQRKNSLGLVGVQERVLMLGGEITIDTVPDFGTSIEVIFPYQQVK